MWPLSRGFGPNLRIQGEREKRPRSANETPSRAASRPVRCRSGGGLTRARAHLQRARPLVLGYGLAGRGTYGRAADRTVALAQARVEAAAGLVVHASHIEFLTSRWMVLTGGAVQLPARPSPGGGEGLELPQEGALAVVEEHGQPRARLPLAGRPDLDKPGVGRVRVADDAGQPRVRRTACGGGLPGGRLAVDGGGRGVVFGTLGELPDDLPPLLAACGGHGQGVGVRTAFDGVDALHVGGVFQQVNQVVTVFQGAHLLSFPLVGAWPVYEASEPEEPDVARRKYRSVRLLAGAQPVFWRRSAGGYRAGGAGQDSL